MLLGSATGRPHQELNLPEAPVASLASDFWPRTNQWHIWHLHPDFDASTPSDYHFLLDPTAGRVTFGDGAKGRVPPKDALIIAAFHATRAEDGNLDQGSVNKLTDALHNRALLPDYDDVKEYLVEITNPFRAVGGSAAKTVARAAGRAIELIEKPNRAVTLADCEALAMETPGVRLARVSARANLHPGLPCFKAPGIITVIILPYLPADRPMPGREPLNRSRLSCPTPSYRTRIEVVGPTYLNVSVQAQVRSFKGLTRRISRKGLKKD
jgi:predicted phage baseplate assembly protein